MEAFNFDEVEVPSGISMTMPGTIGLFNIGKVEFGNSKTNQTPFMKLTYNCKKRRENDGKLVDEQSSFNHSYYMTSTGTKGGALQRVQYLAEVMFGQKFSGKLSEEALTQAFLGKDVALKVSGQTGNNGKGYPDLSFAGYAKKASDFLADPSILSFNSQEAADIKDALDAIKESRSSNADSEASGAGAPAPGSSKKPF